LTPHERKNIKRRGFASSATRGHRLFQRPELKAKEAVGAPSKQK
jgi:hypothetical protein